MKQNLRLILMTLLCAVFSTAWGQTDSIASGTFNGNAATYTEGWATTGTGVGRTDCIVIGAGENITSPALDLSGYSKITVSIKARRYGSLSGSKATIDVSIGGTSVGSVDATGTNAKTQLEDIVFTPSSSMTAAALVFTCTNATSAGSTHGAGINSIIIKGTTGEGETVDIPTFSPAAGTFTTAQSVTISCATDGATIYYTMDGTAPSSSSTKYTSPITISETTTLKAIAIKGEVSSSVASATYTIEAPPEGGPIASGEFNGKEEIYPEGWTTTGTGKNRTDCIVIGAEENITSPAFDFTKYSKIIITIKARRYGTMPDSKAIIDASINGKSVGTTEATSTNANTKLTTIEFPTTKSMTNAVLVFTCTNATSAGSTHGAGINSITITGVEGTPSVPAPTFDPAGGTYYSQTVVNISCEDENAIIYYTTDGTEPTTDSKFFEGGRGYVTINATTTLKAMAVDEDEDFSEITTAVYTIEEMTAFEDLTQLVSETEAGSYLVDPLEGWVTYVNGKYAYIEDTSGSAIVLYKENHGLKAGQTITGPVVVDYEVVNNNPQITDIDTSDPLCEVEDGEVPEPEEVAASAWSYDFAPGILSKYIKVTGATITKENNKFYVQLGSHKVQLYGQAEANPISVEDLNDTYTIVGFPTMYKNTKELMIFLQPVPESTHVVPASESIELAYDATSGEIAYTIINPVEGKSLQATTDADWISNLTVTDEKVTFSTTANEGDANRTATITLSYEGAQPVTITVTQKFFVVDYAELPFEFDGGKDDIANTVGLTQNGIGDDYSASPYLRFNDTDDELVLKFNERPGKLTFDIKGNSFSGGTFTLQASADGTTYTDVQSFTEINNKNKESVTVNDLAEDVRYIKWVYTTKSSGNVALGNISLAKFTGTDPEISFAETSFNVTYGEPFTAPTLSNPHGVAVTYSSDNEDVASVDAETGEVTLNGVEGTATITATSIQDDTYGVGEASYTITVTVPAKDNDDVFELVSTDDLAEGDEVIIVNVKEVTTPADEEAGTEATTTYTYVALGEQRTNNRAAAEVNANADGTLKGNNKLQVITLEAATATDTETGEKTPTGNWWLSVGDGYLYAAGGNKDNHLKTEAAPDADGRANAVITVTEEAASIVFQTTATDRNILRYNASSKVFSCYASGQDDVKIYRKKAGMPGDANGDGTVSVTDVMVAVNYVLSKTPEKFVFKNADVNGDNNVNVSDVMGIVNIVLKRN